MRLRLTGEHAIDVADASGTLLFDVADRRWSEEVCARSSSRSSGCRRRRESTVIAGAGDQAAAALGIGITAPGPVSVVLGTSGVVFAVLPAYAPDAEARVHVFCHAVPGTWHAMGVMLSAAGSAAWLRQVLGTRPAGARRRGGRVGAGRRRAAVRAVPRRRAHAACRRERPRRVHRALGSPRPRRALARDARRGRLRPARLARAAARPRRPARGRTRLRRRRPERALAAHRLGGARPAARAHGLRGGLGLRRGAPRGRARGRLRRRGRGGLALRARARPRSSRIPPGSQPTTHGYSRYRTLYPALLPLEEHE